LLYINCTLYAVSKKRRMETTLLRFAVICLFRPLLYTNSYLWNGFKRQFGLELRVFNFRKSQMPIPINTDSYIRSKDLDTTELSRKGLVSLDLYCCQKETQIKISREIDNWVKGIYYLMKLPILLLHLGYLLYFVNSSCKVRH